MRVDRQRVLVNLHWLLLGVFAVAIVVSGTVAVILARAGVPFDFLLILSLLPGLLITTIGLGTLFVWVRPRR